MSQSDIEAQLNGKKQQHDINSLQTKGRGTSSSTVKENPKGEKFAEEQFTNPRERQSTRENISAARGRGATRGNHLARRNVFERREPPKKRRSLIETSSDPNKGQKLYANWHLRRKAELAARNIADSAPDLAALGGLFNASDPSSFQPLRPATLRNLSSNSVPQCSDERRQPIDDGARPEGRVTENNAASGSNERSANDFSRHSNSFKPSTSNRPTYIYGRHGFNAVCYFWYYRGACSKGSDCGYKHFDDLSLPIIPAPGKVSREIADREGIRAPHPEASSTPSRRRTMNEICFFWHKDGTCINGADCIFGHDNFANLPVASGPDIFRRDMSHYPSGADHRLEDERQLRKEKEDRGVRDRRFEPQAQHLAGQPNIPSLSSAPNSPPPMIDTPSGLAGANSSNRPAWNERDPFNSICYFWHTAGTCTRRPGCKYIHSAQSYLPLAPQPTEKASKPCKFWAIGDCHSGERCLYMHSSQGLDPPAPVVAPTGRRKSVAFAVDDSKPEPKSDNRVPTHAKTGPRSPPEEAERFDRTCVFWTRNDCYRGESCWYNHFYESDRPKETNSPVHDSRLNLLDPLADSDSADNMHSNPPLSTDQLPSPSRPDFDGLDVEVEATMSTKTGDNTAKLSMEEYRKNKLDKLLSNRVKEVIFGNDELRSIVVDFGDIRDGAQQVWVQSFSARHTFHFRQMCSAPDFAALYSSLPRQVLWNGSLTVDSADKVAVERMDKISQHLRLYLGGLISTYADFAILIYPAMEEWKVLGESRNFAPGDRMRYLIFHPSVDIKKPLAPKGEAPTLFRKTLAKSLHGLRYRQFLITEKSDITHHFYLMFPSHSNQTAVFFESWIRASDSRCKVYSSETEGSWNFFATCDEIRAGVVLIHESVISYISELPLLYRLIAPSSTHKMFTFWCIGDSSQPYPIFPSAEAGSLGQISVTRLLPHGHAIFLTPSLLVAEPEKARFLVGWFKNKVKKATPGTWKIVCAYDIRTYLLQLALEKALERDKFYEQNHDKPAKDALAAKRGLSYQACEARFKCHEMISDILRDSMKDRLIEAYDSHQSGDIENPIVYADESIDPDNEPSLITWFAGWSIRHLDKFRKYTVVGTNSSSYQSAVRIKNLMKEEASKPRPLPSSSTSGSSITIPQLANDSLAVYPVGGVTKKAPPVSFDGSLESDLPYDPSHTPHVISSPTDELRPAPSQGPKAPQKPSPGLAEGAIEMDTSPDSDGSILTHTRAVDPESTPEILLFCSTTGCNVHTAREYLSNANNNFQQAARLFGIHHSKDQIGQMDIDTGTIDLITSVKAEHTRHLPQVPRLLTATADRQISAPHLPVKYPARVLSPAHSIAEIGTCSPTWNPSPLSPPQFDGPGEERTNSPQSAGSYNFVGVKITNSGNKRTVSSGARPMTTNVDDNGSRQGSSQSEDKESNRNRRPDGVLRSAAPSQDNSRRGSYTSNAVQSPMGEKMDIDSLQQGSSRDGSINTTSMDDESGDTSSTEVRYGSTTSWYRRLRAEGKGWEHIFVEACDNCFKVIGVK